MPMPCARWPGRAGCRCCPACTRPWRRVRSSATTPGRTKYRLLPLYAEDPLPTSLRAAGYGADGQGAVLTPPILREDYTQLRHFLRLALRWATERYASYHVWAVLPLDLEHPEACDDLCAQYLSAGLTLRGMRPMAGADQMLIFSAHGLVKWRDPLRRCHLADPALPRVLERGYAAADFGWGKNGLELVLRPV